MAQEKPDAAIVLGGGINQDGTLSNPLKERVDLAVSLYINNVVGALVLCGAYSYKAKEAPALTEAQATGKYALGCGVSKADVMLESESKDTIGNAYFSKVNILEPHNWHNVIVVASSNHSHKRLSFIFQKVLGPKYNFSILPAEENNDPANTRREIKSLNIAMDWLSLVEDGDHEGVLNVMKANHPAYSDHSKYSVRQLEEMLRED